MTEQFELTEGGAVLMDGNRLRDEIVAELNAEITAAGGPEVCLATVLVGDDKPSRIYVRNKQRKAAEAAMVSRHVELDADASQAEVGQAVGDLARDPGVHGILVQLPLPEGLGRRRSPRVDPSGEGRRRAHAQVDGPAGQGSAGSCALHPAWSHASIGPLRGGDIRQERGGDRPVDPGGAAPGAAARVARGWTPHRRWPTAARRSCRTCAGRPTSSWLRPAWPGWSPPDFVKPGAAVLDVGISRTADGIVGDVDFETVQAVAGRSDADAGRNRSHDDCLPAAEHPGRSPDAGGCPRLGGCGGSGWAGSPTETLRWRRIAQLNRSQP